MKILVLNCGSSSVKYTLFDAQTPIQNDLIERVTNHMEVIQTILEKIEKIDAVGHRVVHGGDKYHESVLIDESVLETITSLIPLAPLHNPANLAGIKAVSLLYPDLPQVAVFDTAFHQSIPDYAYRYPLPKQLYSEAKIRRYGFHGISHRYMAKTVSTHLNKSDINLITFHLGNGDSVCAIRNGKSVDTSMGFTPLEGLMMGTRCGDIDPEIILYLEREQGYSIEQIEKLLNKESGLKGICGVSDMRDVMTLAQNGDSDAALAIEMFAYHAKKYLGAYLAVLGDVDGIVFTGGIGEHSALIRAKILENLNLFGIKLDLKRNAIDHIKLCQISAPDSSITIFTLHTDEEAMISEETMRLVF